MRKNIVYWGCLAATLLSSWFWQNAASQEREERKPQKPESAGVATGAPHAPVKDAMSRPITAGGFVDGAPVVFIDITKHADRKSTRLNTSHVAISYAVFCLQKKNKNNKTSHHRPASQ